MMGWRKKMRLETVDTNSNPKSNNSNNSNIQGNSLIKINIADIADIAPKNKNEKSIQDQYETLWKKAWALADLIDDCNSGTSIEDRRAMLPELDKLRAELSRLESLGARADS